MNGIILYIVIFFLLFSILNYKYIQEKLQKELALKRNEVLDVDTFFYSYAFLKASKRRKIWIYLKFDKNSRVWDSFGSRTSTKLNLSYVNLCIKSIIDWCAQSYDIIIFSDPDLNEILEEDVDISNLSGNLLDKYRHISLMKILHKYGGVIVPPSLFLKGNLAKIDNDKHWYVCDINNSTNVSLISHIPSTFFTGSNQENPELLKYIEHLNGLENEECHFSTNYLLTNNIPIVDGTFIGTKDENGKKILLEDLMSSDRIVFSENNIGLYMPHEDLVKRKIYNWFCKMSEEQVLHTHCNFSYFMLDSCKDS